MNDIQAASRSTSSAVQLTTPAPQVQSASAYLPDAPAPTSLHISAEGQYLFEMNKYLSGLDGTERADVLAYLSQGSDPLQQKAAGHFQQTQQQLIGLQLNIQQDDDTHQRNLLNVNFVLDESTAVVLRPLTTAIFRLDEKDDFIHSRRGNLQPLRDQLEKLEHASAGMFGAQDSANLFGAVDNALAESGNIFYSLDDVLYFNYVHQKAKDAIAFFDVPEDMKSALNNFLTKGVKFQAATQQSELEAASAFANHNLYGSIVRENLRLGSAAQHFNYQYRNALESNPQSVLDSGALLNELLATHPDLARFSLDKINDALSYYEKDYAGFERALNKDFASLQTDSKPFFDSEALNAGSDYALKVIGQIQSYVARGQ